MKEEKAFPRMPSINIRYYIELITCIVTSQNKSKDGKDGERLSRGKHADNMI